MRATWLADVLRDAGLTVKPYDGWETRGRDDFEPVGVILHHTVTKPTTSDAVVDRLLAVTGSSTVSPPLCQYSTNRDGSVSIIAAGTANHGGVGRWNGVSGNKFWFGDEMKNAGTAAAEPWVPRQLESAYRAAAAILTHLGQDSSWVTGHKEYATPPGRKTDPHTISLDTVRKTVGRIMEDHMALSDEDKAWITDTIKKETGFANWAGVYTMPDPKAPPTGFHPNTVLRIVRGEVATILELVRQVVATGRTLTTADIDAIIAEQAESFGLVERD